ncbi:Protein-ribulosamine 3-kinase [Saliniradius amylolyticus]|uniref:Protein-ribulosamine 3-kinase n=1 Tax=Saliniradius amylolyticus TaxID=2183582 RepID=A0A2S2E2F1_9ALTE|nr:fructosamine kinase family protein [Saliniradius amylolyticus]AWL11825.1 Protein-ribulosamine 3-kinase [Saliniradius amylolyticus]
MWHFISEQISQSLGIDFVCDDIRQLGQQFTQSFRIANDKRRFFVKLGQPNQLAMLEAEANGLTHLAQAADFDVPKVICVGQVSQHSFLVLSYIRFEEGDHALWGQLGRALARFHRQDTQAMYGWEEDNYIGSTPQLNRWHKKWHRFFAEQRIGYQLQRLSEASQLNVHIDRVVDSVQRLLAGHQPLPSPLHGDLWQGNVGFSHQRPILYDPAYYYGDRETDLAMTELFGGFPHTFYEHYQDEWPLPEEYQYRKSVYQLYHILNHALMFGGHYLQSAQQHLDHLEY